MRIPTALLLALVEQGGQKEALLKISGELLKVKTTLPLAGGDRLMLHPESKDPSLIRLRVVSRASVDQLGRLKQILVDQGLEVEESSLPFLNEMLEYKIPLDKPNIQALLRFLGKEEHLSEEELQVFLFFLKAHHTLSRAEAKAYSNWVRADIRDEGVAAFLKEGKLSSAPFFLPWVASEKETRGLLRWEGSEGDKGTAQPFRFWWEIEGERVAGLGFWQKPKLYLQVSVEKEATQKALEETKIALSQSLSKWGIELSLLQIRMKPSLDFTVEMLEREKEKFPLVWASG